jgi:aspartate carbamoyltransferase regulatory subunit
MTGPGDRREADRDRAADRDRREDDRGRPGDDGDRPADRDRPDGGNAGRDDRDDHWDADHELRVTKIRNGTVIDHVSGGLALTVLGVLGIDGSAGEVVSIGMNVPSEPLARKDIFNIENRELSQDEVDVLSLLAPAATINIVRAYQVREKHRVDCPAQVSGVLSCPNPDCITAGREPVTSTFDVLDRSVRCVYCETILDADLTDHVDIG